MKPPAATRLRPAPRRLWRGPVRALLAVAVLATLLLAACGWWTLETRSPPMATRQQAPAFELPDHRGKMVSLAALLERGPAVVIFYRGHW